MASDGTSNEALNDIRPIMDEGTPTLTWWERIVTIVKNITVEPVIAFYIMPGILKILATQNLNLDKACRVNMNYGDEVCDALMRRETANYTKEEDTVQQMVAHMVAWKSVIQSFFPFLLILFWGSWSDRHHRRKPCMIIPLAGEFLGTIGLILCVYFERTPMEVAGVIEAVFPGLTGDWVVMVMGVFSYIADITTEEDRTLRVGIVNIFFSLGVPIGTALSGVLLKEIGFYGVFSVSASCYFLCLLYCLYILPEARPKDKPPADNNRNVKCLLVDFFDKKHIVETFRVAFKKGGNQRRKRVILLMIAATVIMGPHYGEKNISYLYARYRFNWDEVDFSLFSTFSVIVGLVGFLISVGFLSHKLRIDDTIIGILSSMGKVLSGFFYGLAKVAWLMYVGSVVEIFNGISTIAMRSMASKLVSKDELGKVNSLFGVTESLVAVIFAPIYSSLYAATLTSFPGAFYLLSSAITFISVLIFLWMYKFQRQQIRQQQIADSESTNDPHDNSNTTDPIDLESDDKEFPNAMVSNDLHEQDR